MGGVPKGTLSLGDTTPLERLAERFSRILDRVAVVRRSEQDWTVPEGIDVLEDRGPGDGPLRGIYTGLQELKGPVLAAAWDQIKISESMLEGLREEARRGVGWDVLLYSTHRRIQPFPGVYSGGLADPLRDYLTQGHRSVVTFLEQRSVAVARPSGGTKWFCPPERFFDLDDWSDYRRATAEN